MFKKKKKMNLKVKSSWEELTIGDLMELKSIENSKLPEDERRLHIGALMTNMSYDDFISLPLSDTKMVMDRIDQLLKDMPSPKRMVKRRYHLNGSWYELLKDSDEMTVSQYMNFQTIYPMGFEEHIPDLLAIYLVPVGHQYNDGYDMEKVMEDISTLPLLEGLAIANFFTRKYRRLIRYLVTALWLNLKRLKRKNKGMEEEAKKAMDIQIRLIMDELERILGSTV